MARPRKAPPVRVLLAEDQPVPPARAGRVYLLTGLESPVRSAWWRLVAAVEHEELAPWWRESKAREAAYSARLDAERTAREFRQTSRCMGATPHHVDVARQKWAAAQSDAAKSAADYDRARREWLSVASVWGDLSVGLAVVPADSDVLFVRRSGIVGAAT